MDPTPSSGLTVDLTGRVALVTGAAMGIGRSVALGLARCGARVFGADVDESIRAAAGEWSGPGFVADVGNPEAVTDMVDACVGQLGPPDILVNVAAVSTPCLVRDMPLENWQRNLDVNLTSVFLCTRAVLPLMLERRRGSIVSFSSVIAHTGGKSSAHYAAAKAGIEGFSRSLAREVGSMGIRVNVVAPGMVETRMLGLMDERQKESLAKRNPIPRIGTPEELVGAVLFLSSDAASYITGQTLHVNGGMSVT